MWEIHKSKKEKKRKQEENDALLQEAKKAFEDFCGVEEYIEFFSTLEEFRKIKREWEERLDALPTKSELAGRALIAGIKDQKSRLSPASAEEAFFCKVLKSCNAKIYLQQSMVEFRLKDGSLFVKTIKGSMVIWGEEYGKVLGEQDRLQKIVKQYSYHLLTERGQEEKEAREEARAKYLQTLAESAEAARQAALDAYLGERHAGE